MVDSRIVAAAVVAALAANVADAAERGSRGVRVVRAPTGEALVGDNWLLVVAIGRYREWAHLRGPAKDVAAIKKVLLDRYAFDTNHLVELRDEKATKEGIIRALRDLGGKLRPEDSLLVYYAGHGYTDEMAGTGYWIPHDAGKDMTAQERWLPNAAVRGYLRTMKCAHVLLVSDSCFSGDLLDEERGREPEITDAYFRRAYQMQARQVLTSGASEPVSDSDLGGHSAFAFHLVRTLESNRHAYLDPLQLYVHIRAGVKGQMPLLGSLKGAGHQDGGAYVFFLREGGAAGRTATAPTPPSAGIDLSDLTRQSETRKQRDAWLTLMKADYREVERFAAGSTDASLNVRAWQRFLATYRQDDPLSTEDESLRAKAGRELTRWRAEAKRPRQTAAPAGKTLTLDCGGGVSMDLVLIPAGVFTMGSPNSEGYRSRDEGPQHRVRITRPFYMGKYEVTQSQYERIMDANLSKFRGTNNPVDTVSWNDATEFCRKLSQRTGRKVRLPTEAEWEYACRAGTTTPFHFGKSLSSSQANFNGRFPYGGAAKGVSRNKTTSVGSFPANAWGLHDMHGNLWEWCSDWLYQGYYAKSPQNDPTGPANGSYRVLRGGSWRSNAESCRSAYRERPGLQIRHYFIGFRVAVSLSPGE